VILFGGRITWAKGTYQLLAALNILVEKRPDVLLLVLTNASLASMGFDRPQFQALRERHVRLGGWFSGPELAAVYRAVDIVTMPSIYVEPAGMIILEGMAAAKPIVATCHGGPPELMIDGETGYSINPYDTATFADRLERLLADSSLAQRMGSAGRQLLDEKFTLAMNRDNMLAIYEEALKR